MRKHDVRNRNLALNGRPMSAPIDFTKPHPMRLHPLPAQWVQRSKSKKIEYECPELEPTVLFKGKIISWGKWLKILKDS